MFEFFFEKKKNVLFKNNNKIIIINKIRISYFVFVFPDDTVNTFGIDAY